jgi:glycosyltransferase involved in cell wall biosynthesis
MACGLPVVGCNGSGVEEIVKSGVNGLLVSPKNVSELEEALRKILSDETLRSQMGTKARDFVVREADS